jgi:predicted TIM-barrel fold metal-dependent hydrolase
MNPITGGADTHVHIIGNQLDYPMVAERRYTPDFATAESLQAHLQGQGLERTVIIQPSIYGFDNRCTLDALRAMQVIGVEARGVLVLPQSTTNAELQAFDAQGARGIRLNIESTGNFSADDLAEQLQFWGVRLADICWHIQVYAPMTWIAQCADVIAKLPVPVVLDHFALWADADCASAEARTLLDLLATGNIYIKLSASYRLLIDCPTELEKLVHRFLFLRSDRLLWGSDWPHTNRETGKAPTQVSRFKDIGAARLLDERRKWLDGSDWQQQILVDNPNQLYRF